MDGYDSNDDGITNIVRQSLIILAEKMSLIDRLSRKRMAKWKIQNQPFYGGAKTHSLFGDNLSDTIKIRRPVQYQRIDK